MDLAALDTIELDGDDIAYPFAPKFELLIPQSTTFKILRPTAPETESKLDFSIAVTAKTALNYTSEF
jgi:hypothetical protein